MPSPPSASDAPDAPDASPEDRSPHAWASDRTTSDRTTSDRITSDRTTSDRPASDRPASASPEPDRPGSDSASPDLSGAAKNSRDPKARRPAERPLLNLAGNDYLALSSHPKLKAAAIEAIRAEGVGAGASRLVSGARPVHASLEKRFAAFKRHEAALFLPTGFMANLAALSTLARPGDLICLDKLNHASLIDAARASGAEVRRFPHGRLEKLERLLRRFRRAGQEAHEHEAHGHAAGRPTRRRDRAPHTAAVDEARAGETTPRRAIIVTDSVFSMDGDLADLPRLCELRDRYEAILVIDEAHGTGVLGEHGAGLAEAQGVADRVDVTISTASKALGGLGGIVSGPEAFIDAMINKARSFIYTTAPPAAQAAAVHAALDVVVQEPWRRRRLATMRRRLDESLQWTSPAIPTPIIPVIVGDARHALELADRLRRAGFHAPAIRPPTVPPGTARVRLSLRADLQDHELDRLADVLRRHAGPIASPAPASSASSASPAHEPA